MWDPWVFWTDSAIKRIRWAGESRNDGAEFNKAVCCWGTVFINCKNNYFVNYINYNVMRILRWWWFNDDVPSYFQERKKCLETVQSFAHNTDAYSRQRLIFKHVLIRAADEQIISLKFVNVDWIKFGISPHVGCFHVLSTSTVTWYYRRSAPFIATICFRSLFENLLKSVDFTLNQPIDHESIAFIHQRLNDLDYKVSRLVYVWFMSLIKNNSELYLL